MMKEKKHLRWGHFKKAKERNPKSCQKKQWRKSPRVPQTKLPGLFLWKKIYDHCSARKIVRRENKRSKRKKIMQINFLIECILKLNERIFVSPHNNFYFFAKILRFQWFNRSERTKNKTFFKIFTFKKQFFSFAT